MFLGEMKENVRALHGVGPAALKELSGLGIFSVGDLLQYYPRTYEDRKNSLPLFPDRPIDLTETRIVNTVVTVKEHVYFGWGAKRTLKVKVTDGTGDAFLLCFGRPFLAGVLLVEESFYLYGKFNYRYGEYQSSFFEFEPYTTEPANFKVILPVYPLSGTLTQKFFRKTIKLALEKYAKYLDSGLPEYLIKESGFLSIRKAIEEVHFPESKGTLLKSEETLKYEELFYLQLTIGRRIMKHQNFTRKERKFGESLKQKLIEQLPFLLTADQQKVLMEIANDVSGPHPMFRLLQGDVGCGKTLVAFLSALPCIEAGVQVALMAPTELLARQHADTAVRLMGPLGVKTAFLSASIDREARKVLLSALNRGEIEFIVGTHALFTKDVKYKNLGFVIVDEQQRFGVLQRKAIMSKGPMPDLLLMTATPIPRTMALAFLGDIRISTINMMPPGRKPVITHLTASGNEEKVYSRVRRELEKGNQAYFVYPLISESDKLELKDTETMFRKIAEDLFPEFPAGLIHSKIPETEKASTMKAFNSEALKILVATSVVEVGVDVPRATCIVIEHAERFGLSALHQLRGRVGRGDLPSYAFLIFSNSLTEEGKKRLKIIKENADGFAIAEEDLKLRGPGDVAGVRQSGYFKLKIADIITDFNILKKAKIDAQSILERDIGFLKQEHRVIREMYKRAPPFSEGVFEGG